MQTQPDEMSDFAPPDLKKTLSVRVPASLHRKLGVIQENWRTHARAAGMPEELVEAIDLTYTVSRLLAGRADEELAQWGGMPETPEARTAMTKAIVAATKKQQR